MILLLFILTLSLAVNGILVWYCRKLVKNLWNGVNNVEELHKLLIEYSNTLESLYQLEELYGDETIKIAINNTKLIIEACRMYKENIMQTQEQNSDETNL